MLDEFLVDWCLIKNHTYRGDAGLQFSINSTDDAQRDYLFGGSSHTLSYISDLATTLPNPKGRKYTLNFPLYPESIVCGKTLAKLFDPKDWIVKLTPMHAAYAAKDNNIYGEFVYKSIEESCKENGFDVIVFIPSEDEELGRITCGNVCLAHEDAYI